MLVVPRFLELVEGCFDSDHTKQKRSARRLRLLSSVGGQHKNYPIINNIREQRKRAILKGLSLQSPVVGYPQTSLKLVDSSSVRCP